MYKKTSQHSVSRDRRAVTDDTHNAGMDETAFRAGTTEREMLALETKEMENKSSQINFEILLLKSSAGQGKFADSVKIQALMKEKLLLQHRITENIKRMMVLKAELGAVKQKKHDEEQLSFDNQFRLMAKRLLVPDIYDRIVTAALHTMGEGQ